VSRSVLVIDDDRSMVKTLCAVLRLHGWNPTAGYSGEDAIREVRGGSFAAVIMDVCMPGLSGVEAFRVIRQEYPRLPIMLMTAYANPELLAQAQNEGVLMILPKPLPIGKLTETLSDLSQNGPVLVVDDEPEFLKTLTSILASRKHKVLHATTLDDALAMLTDSTPAVIVMDLKLGDLTPMDAVLAVKRVSPEVLLILYSGYPELLDKTVATLPAGAVYATLHKPFAPDHLLELLNGINRHQLH
jgi:DNA-binding NtrC family response regulator